MKQRFTLSFLLSLFICSYSFSQSAGDYRSNVTTSGDWSVALNWQIYNGAIWQTALTAPSSSDGVITIKSGDSITLTAATTINEVQIESGGVLAIFNALTATTFTVANDVGIDIINNGKLYISNNATLTGSGTLQNGSTGVLILRNGGVFELNAANDGTMQVTGGAIINNSAITNNGSFYLLDSTLALNTSTLQNNNIISLTSTGNCSITTTSSTDTGFITNTSSGIIFKTSALGIATFSPTVKFLNDGTVKGFGEYIFANTITNTGIIEPGDNSTGILTVNPSFITGKTATLKIDINSLGGVAGTNYDQLGISAYDFSTVNFSGITLSLLDNALDTVGSVYKVVNAASTTILGPFGNTIIPSNFGNITFAGKFVTIKKLSQNIVWDGGAGTANWNDAANWNPNVVPRIADNVTIDMGTSVLVNTAAVCHDLTLNSSGLVVTLQSGNSLIVNGDLTLTLGQLNINGQSLVLNGTMVPSGTGTITGSSNSSLTIGGTTGGDFGILRMTATPPNNYVKNFTLSRTGMDGSMSIGSNGLGLTGIMILTNGILNTGGYLTLVSSSIAATGCIAPINTATANINGLVTVERFIPSPIRAFRDIAPTVNSGSTTIFTNWQEGGNNTNGYGTQITGSVGTAGTVDPATGFDRTQSGNKSMYSMNISTVNGAANWETVNSTNQANDTLSAFKAYRISIRGNRQNDLSLNGTAMNAPATLRSKGTLLVGPVSFDATGVTANGGTNTGIRLNNSDPLGFSMVGNPYPSPIDWETIHANSTNLDNSYWVFDPNMGTTGAYVTYSASLHMNSDASSHVNQYIQPGEGFFTRNDNSTAPVLLINESDKATSAANLTTVFRTSNVFSRMYFNLLKTVGATTYSMDGSAIAFSNSFNNNVGHEDAGKISNGSDNLAINNQNTFLSIEGRKEPTIADTISLRIWTVTAGTNYQLKLNLAEFTANGLQPVLLDRFTNAQTMLQAGSSTNYPFTVTSDTNSYNNRFRIVFTNGALPITFNSIKVRQKANDAELEWSCSETDALYYDIEHSLNGTSFDKLASVNAKNPGASSIVDYEWLHNKTPLGTNFYRVKAVDKTGTIKYSNIVNLNISKNIQFTIYPNPVKGNSFNLQLASDSKGSTVDVFNAMGQKIFSNLITGSSLMQTMAFQSKPAAGNYLLTVTGTDGNKTSSTLIIQ